MKVLLVQRSLAPPGGGNAVAAWMAHALAGEHDLGTLTARSWSAAATNAFYGTSIPERGIRRHVVPSPWSWLETLPENRATRLRMCAVLRYARPLARDYDLMITADNYGAFARPGVQYVHFPAPLQPQPAFLAPLVRIYFAFADAFVGIPWTAAARNLTLANSTWTAAGLEHVLGVRPRVLYPPVIDPGAGRPWEHRRNTFLCIGRFTGSKRIPTAMSIVRRLRARVLPDARLIIVGSPVDREYTARLYQSAARDRDWIEFREDLSRDAVNRLIGESRYALQAMEDEHFGMATAELARGGCLVFAHHSGGTPEVLGDPALLWTTEDEALARIGSMVGDAAARDAVRRRLRAHARRFAPERFVADLRAIVNAWRSGELAKAGILQ